MKDLSFPTTPGNIKASLGGQATETWMNKTICTNCLPCQTSLVMEETALAKRMLRLEKDDNSIAAQF